MSHIYSEMFRLSGKEMSKIKKEKMKRFGQKERKGIMTEMMNITLNTKNKKANMKRTFSTEQKIKMTQHKHLLGTNFVCWEEGLHLT